MGEVGRRSNGGDPTPAPDFLISGKDQPFYISFTFNPHSPHHYAFSRTEVRVISIMRYQRLTKDSTLNAAFRGSKEKKSCHPSFSCENVEKFHNSLIFLLLNNAQPGIANVGSCVKFRKSLIKYKDL